MKITLDQFLGLLKGRQRSIVLLVSLWVLTMISLPILRWTFGQAILQTGIVMGVVIQCVAVLAILVEAWGWKDMLYTAGCVLLAAWVAEAVGSATGFPFGNYAYTAVLQPKVAGVPLLIPFAWLMMLPPAWGVAAAVLPCRDLPPSLKAELAFSGVSALAFTAWDLFLDPQMVAWNFWVWQDGGGYFGIPWTNYLGWLLVSAIVTALLRPRKLPVNALIVIYAITWALESIGQAFFWELPGPALFGFLGMGGMLAWALLKKRSRFSGQAL